MYNSNFFSTSSQHKRNEDILIYVYDKNQENLYLKGLHYW